MSVFPKQVKLNLRGKVFILIESLVVVLVVFTGAVTTKREKTTLENEFQKRGMAVATDMATFTAEALLSRDLATLRRCINHAMAQDYVLHAFILDPEAVVVMHNDLTEVGKAYQDALNAAALESKRPGCIRISGQADAYFDIFAPIRVAGVRLGTIRLGYSQLAIEKEMATARRQIFLIGIVTAVIGGMVAYVLAAFISFPIKQITNAIEKVAADDLVTPLNIKRNDEIGTLAKSFNQMTDELRKTTISKDFVDNIIGSMNDMLIVVDPNTRIRNVNKATCDLLEYQEDELIGRNFDLVVPKEENIFAISGFRKRQGEASVVNRQVHYVTKSGKSIPVLFSSAILRNKDGDTLGAVGIARDITERIQAEEALKKSEKKLRLLSYQLLTAQEEERRRLSTELHDELGQSLMVLKLKVRAIQREFGTGANRLSRECEDVIGYINEVTENVRRLSRNLSPSLLEGLGLSAAIRRLVETAAEHGNVEISHEMTDLNGLFSKQKQIVVYRILQECMTNIGKHSHASHVSIDIETRDGHVCFRVEDNGIGFDVQEAWESDPAQKGLGLTTMQERAGMLGAKLDIWSQEGVGTTVMFAAPIEDRGN